MLDLSNISTDDLRNNLVALDLPNQPLLESFRRIIKADILAELGRRESVAPNPLMIRTPY